MIIMTHVNNDFQILTFANMIQTKKYRDTGPTDRDSRRLSIYSTTQYNYYFEAEVDCRRKLFPKDLFQNQF